MKVEIKKIDVDLSKYVDSVEVDVDNFKKRGGRADTFDKHLDGLV